MSYFRRIVLSCLLLATFLAACAPASTETTSSIPATDSPIIDPTPSDESPSPANPTQETTVEGSASAEAAAWRSIPLVNSRTGESFTLADFAGKTVFVEAMATWCSNCRSQMRQVREAITLLNSSDFVFVGVSVETNISAADLAAYVDAQGFEWTFAVLSPEALIALTDEFGRSISNPPATPHFVIRPDGTFSELITGRIHSAQELVDELSAAGGA